MVKIYVIDTNVLIQAPYGLNCFEDNQVVLPVVVLEELDNLKKSDGEIGTNVRRAIRMLEELRLQGDLLEGVALPGGGTLRVELNYKDVELPPDLPDTKSDNRILKVCMGLSKEKKEQLIDSNEQSRYENEEELQDKVQEVFDRGIIQAEAMNFIRGRSIVKTYLIIDEAQNMTPNQMKGLITRAGKDTKIILLGDPNQIDRPFLDERTNELSYAAEHMKGSPFCWQVTLTAEECERSRLAADAITRM